MTHPVANTLTALMFGEPTTRGRLSMYPLVAEREQTPDYLLLDEAMGLGLCQVQELTEAGVVGRLLLVNRAHLPILLLDGDLLVGARQNRVLNLTMLAPAKAKTELPVSCVEQGRWSYHGGRGFHIDAQSCSVNLRAAKAATLAERLRRGRVGDADQRTIWAEIQAKSVRMGVRSVTGDYTALHESHDALLAELVAGFEPLPRQVGGLFTLDNRILGLDLFDCPRTLTRVLPRLLRGYAIEALDPLWLGRDEHSPSPEAFFEELRGAQPTQHPAPGLGDVAHIETAGLAANALIHAGRVLHLFAYPRQATGDLFDP